MAIPLELRRRLPDNTDSPWTLRDAGGEDDLPTDPVSDVVLRARADIATSVLRDAIVNALTSLQTALETISIAGNVEITNDAGNPIPVNGTVNVGNFPAATEILNDVGNPIPVNGTVIANLGAIGSAATETTLDDARDQLVSILAELQNKLEDGGTVALDAAALAALENITVAVSSVTGAVEITNDAGNPIPVNGNVAVTGPLTDTQLRAAPVPVSGTVTATPDGIQEVSQGAEGAESEAWWIRDGEPEPLIAAGVLTSSGDTVIVDPPSGQAVRIRWVYAIDAVTDPSPVITVKLGTNTKYSAYAISKKQRLTGATNENLIMNLSSSAAVAYTVFYDLV